MALQHTDKINAAVLVHSRMIGKSNVTALSMAGF
jgi:hypothetical protein